MSEDNRSEIINLFKFLDWVMVLPKHLTDEFWTELRTYEEGLQMPYITSVEQIGYERGVKEGEQRERRSLALKMLQEQAPIDLISRVTGFSVEQLEQLQVEVQQN